jgi:salicylate hydroxylase
VSRRALIAGAGIGGLTAAIALARIGFDVAVFERAERLAEVGAGLQLTPNATRVLDKLDLLAPLARRAMAPRAIRILRGHDGGEIVSLPLNARERWGAPYFVLMRADLQRALLERAAAEPRIKLSLGGEAAGCAEEETGVVLGLKRGSVMLAERGGVLIGADGLKSAIRERLGLGDREAARFSGRVAFRATIPAQDAWASARAPEVCLRLGARAHLVHYPVAGGAMINLVAVIEAGWRVRPGEDPWDGEADRAALQAAFAHWSKDARALIAAPHEWRAWPLRLRPPLVDLARGRIALLGDAAHPMLPFLAQGAGQAIEDAGILAECLAATEDIASALAAYSQRRAPRVARMQRESEAQARLYHMAGPLAAARDIGMRVLGPERLLRRYDWIYGA